jgi:hypothetical protein
MLNLQSFDLAQETVRERLQLAAYDALADQLAAASTRPSPISATRLLLASGLRALAVRLDPTNAAGQRVEGLSARDCEPCLVVVPLPR